MTPDPRRLAEARSAAYALFAYLFRFGVTAEIEPAAREVDGIQVALARFTREDGTLDLDALAAEHHRVFGMEVHAAESVFLDPAGHPGGEITQAAADRHRAVGHALDPTAEVPDHLSVELDALSFLTGAVADAWRDDLPSEAHRVDEIARAFSTDRLLTWLPPFSHAVALARSPLATAMVEAMVEVLAHHASEAPELSVPALPEVTAPALEDPSTKIRDIVHYLASPARCGLLLSLSDLAEIGRRLELPRGFGARELVLTNLIESAVEHDAVPGLLDALDDRRRTAEVAYRVWARRPTVGVAARPWLERAHALGELLGRMRAEIGALAP